MFVLSKTYASLELKYLGLKAELTMITAEYSVLANKWAALVNRINAKGGESFIQQAPSVRNNQFTQAEIETLIKLCHPDKHNGAKDANVITAKLLEMRTKK